ncbi:DNA primase family protein [Fibrella aestuarina]|nr:phage/plasmid primase, P4 family [Fibrella aestuarina]
MSDLLQQIGPVNFREKAGVGDDEDAKLSKAHYLVIIVQVILELARVNHWNLCQANGAFYIFNGAFYKEISPKDLRRFLQDAAVKMGADRFKCEHYEFAEQIFRQFEVTAHLPVPLSNREIIKINLQNGTYTIDRHGRGQLKKPDPADFLTHQLPFAFDPNAQCPLWQKHLDKVLPDASMQQILAEYIGYVFTSTKRMKLEKTLVLLGEGGNGKSVVYDVITGLLGSENISSHPLDELTKKETYRAEIADKLLNYCSEIASDINVSVFKAMTSGEALNARRLYGKPFQIEDYAKLLTNANRLPIVTEHSHAWFRRFLILPFEVQIKAHEKDIHLARKIITTELAGVFNWALAGLARLLAQNDFTDSEQVRQQNERYRNESDTVGLFLAEYRYEPYSETYEALQQLYNQYTSFCREDGHRNFVTKLNFRRRLETRGFLVGERNIGRVVFTRIRALD